MKRFVRNPGGVIHDTETGLEWLAGPDKNTNWTQARTWAAKQRVDGGNWRMPNLKELQTLFIEDSGPGNMPEVFNVTAHYVWSGEEKDSKTAWAFFYPLGGEDWSTRAASYNFRVFAVRKSRVPV